MNKFPGVWRLVTFEERAPDGELIYPYGRHPAGLLVYDETGHMSVQIMRRDRPDLTSTDWQKISPEEIKAAAEGFTAFFGTYEIDEGNSIIIHRVEGHLLPNGVGKDLKRAFEFSSDRLILKPTENRRVIWERIK